MFDILYNAGIKWQERSGKKLSLLPGSVAVA
jgi:hypothetical protein